MADCPWVLGDRITYVGLDVHNDGIVVAVAEGGPKKTPRGRRGKEAVEMKPDKNMKLADLMYGHGSKSMCSLSGRFDPEKYPMHRPFKFAK